MKMTTFRRTTSIFIICLSMVMTFLSADETVLAAGEDAVTVVIPSETTKVDKETYKDYHYLKYIKLEHANSNTFIQQLINGAFDFSLVENLEAVYMNMEVTDAVKGKIKVPSGVEIVQYVDLSTKTFPVSQAKYSDGKVTFSFEALVDNMPGYGYRVVRDSQGEPEEFDTEGDDSNFDISNGTVTFTDVTVEAGKEYTYSIFVYEPFGSSAKAEDVKITIPAGNDGNEGENGKNDGLDSKDESSKIEDEKTEGNGTDKPEKGKSRVPKTGDANYLLTFMLFVSSFAALTFVLRKKA